MADSLCDLFQMQVAQRGTETALRNADGSVQVTWREYGDRVRRLAGGLAGLGVAKGDVVALMLGNTPEFHFVDAAAMHLGAITLSIYNTSTIEQIAYLLSDSAPRAIVIERRFLPQVRTAIALSAESNLATIICVDGQPEGTIALDDLACAAPTDFDFDASWTSITRNDILTLIYTSGTTGNPKGVELAHSNMLYEVEAVASLIDGLLGGRVVSYLPDAHLLNRWICQYAPMYFGITVTDVDDPKGLLHVLTDVHPTFFVAVPMLWYKFKDAVEHKIAEMVGPKGKLARWAIAAGQRKAAAEVAGTALSPRVAVTARLADRLVLAKLRASLGFDALGCAVSGAAPIDIGVLQFMLALGVPVMEGWGMTETCALTTINPPTAPRFGSVGKPIPGTEIRLAPDGEVLVRGDGVMVGYRNDPVRTAQTLDGDGWIRTGDIGTIDNGYLSIVDRKKEIIINSSGKNMSPANIESSLKAASPLIGSALAVGDQRPHVVALLTLDRDAAIAFANMLGFVTEKDDFLADLIGHPALRTAIKQAVLAANTRLSRVEQVRSWDVLPVYWEPGGDELTPTMKLRRSYVHAKYATQVDALYH